MKTKILLTLCILTTVLFTGCGAKIEQSADATTIEVGSDFSFVGSDFFTSDKSDALNEIVADTSAVDTSTVGSYPITVTYKKDTYAITVNVVDTVAPTIKLKEELHVVAEGDIVKAVDFVNVEDMTTCAVYFIQPDNTEVEEMTIVAGTNVFNIVAVDESNNKSDIVEYTVEIETVVESSIGGKDTETEEEINEQIEEAKKEEQQSGVVEGDNTNGGKGYDLPDGTHYDTVEEYIAARQEYTKKHSSAVSQEEFEAFENSFLSRN